MLLFHQSEALERRLKAGKPVVSERSRFRMLVCSLFCSICVSLVYAFDLFTTEFTTKYHLSAGDLSTISTVGLVFCYFTLPFGFLYDYAGPLPIFVISLLVGGLGSLLLALTLQDVISGSVAKLSVFYAMLNLCSGLVDVGYIVTLAEVFPRNRGPVIGLAKVMTGLGGSIFSSISVNIFQDNIVGFVYFIMAYVIVVCCIACGIVILPPYIVNGWRRRGKSAEVIAKLRGTERDYRIKSIPLRRLAIGYAVVLAILIFMTVQSPIVSYVGVSNGGRVAIGVITILLVLCFFLMLLPIPSLDYVKGPQSRQSSEDGISQRDTQDATSTVDETHSEILVNPQSAGNALTAAEEATISDNEPIKQDVSLSDCAAGDTASVFDDEVPQDPRYNGGIKHLFLSLDLWLLLLAFVCQGGIGTIVVYNASTISTAITGYGRSEQTSALYTAFLGVGSAIGRIAMGLFEGYVQSQDPHNRRFLVTMALPLPPLLGCLAGILLLTIPGSAILFPYILVYFEEGMFAAICALIFPCMYKGNHGVLYNLSFVTTVIGVIGFNRFLFGYVVDAKHDALGFAANEDCNVAECVRIPLIVATCAAAVGALLLFVIHFRYARFVRRERARALTTE